MEKTVEDALWECLQINHAAAQLPETHMIVTNTLIGFELWEL